MVGLTEIKNMFWGVTLDGGKRYTQTVETTFHISMAALEPSQNKDDVKDAQYVSVMLQHEKAEFLLCTLEQGKVMQVPLDLNFTEGEEVTFFLNGKGVIHLTGYLAPEMMDGMDSEDDDDEEDESYEQGSEDEEVGSDDEEVSSDDDEVPQLLQFDEVSDEEEESDEDEEDVIVEGKRKKKQENSSKKKPRNELIGDEAEVSGDESDDEDWEDLEGEEDELDDIEEEEEDMEEEAEKLQEEAVNDIGISKKSKKEKKREKAAAEKSPKVETPAPETNGAAPASAEKKKKKKKKKNKNKEQESPAKASDASPAGAADSTSVKTKKMDEAGDAGKKKKTGKKMVLAGGVVAEDIKVGQGPVAQHGKMVGVYYKGTLSKTGKQFDSTLTGAPFRFKLGKQEVIKGWDIGVKDMKVGGIRKLIIPANMAYGSQRQGPIPPNSTLIFTVELKNAK